MSLWLILFLTCPMFCSLKEVPPFLMWSLGVCFLLCFCFFNLTITYVKFSQGQRKSLKPWEFVLIHRRNGFPSHLIVWLLQWCWGENVFWQFVVDFWWVLPLWDIFLCFVVDMSNTLLSANSYLLKELFCPHCDVNPLACIGGCMEEIWSKVYN